MKIKVLGAGSAFTMKSFQSNLLVKQNGTVCDEWKDKAKKDGFIGIFEKGVEGEF